MRMVKPLQTLQ